MHYVHTLLMFITLRTLYNEFCFDCFTTEDWKDALLSTSMKSEQIIHCVQSGTIINSEICSKHVYRRKSDAKNITSRNVA